MGAESPAIEKDDRVEVATLLGISGYTSEPHIHDHRQDTPAQFQDYIAGELHIKRGEPVRLQVIRKP